MAIEFRLATPEDHPGIQHVRTSVKENHLSVEQMAAMGITRESVVAMMLASPCCWVAVEAGQIVGFSMVDNADACLFAAFVLPSHEGQGLGRQLLRLAEQQLFSQHDVIWLETGQSTRAAGFYRKHGWGNEKLVGPDYIRLEKRKS